MNPNARVHRKWVVGFRHRAPIRSILLLLVLTTTWTGGAAGETHAAHPISITRASVYLTRESTDIRIEVFLEDLYLFHQLQPNREDFLDLSVIRQGIKLHEQFLAQRFEITDVEGNRFTPQDVGVAAYELPAEGVPLSDLMGHQLVFELQYVFDQPPDLLTFTQMFTDEDAVLPSETKLEIKQQGGGAAVEHTLLPHEAYSMRINWDNPPLSPEASEEERQQWQDREKQALLGITNYSRVYSFLYIDDFEVRHEILIPYLSLDEDLLLARDDDPLLDLTEQDLARKQIEGYFASGNPLQIDGKKRKPIVQRCDFYGLDMTDFAIASKRRVVPVANARVALILTYRLDTPPHSLELTWNRFNNSVWSVSAAIMGQGNPLRQNLSRLGKRNVLKWTRPEDWGTPPPITSVKAIRQKSDSKLLPVALMTVGIIGAVLSLLALGRRRPRVVMAAGLSTLLAGAAWWQVGDRLTMPPVLPATEKIAVNVFEQLHDNVYAALQRRTEESIYDGLATSVQGDLLRRIYLEIRQGLAQEDDGGATARIDLVQRLDVSRTKPVSADLQWPDADVFGVDCSWKVVGRVEHWGHVHVRDVVYQANFDVADTGESWKLVAMKSFTQASVETSTRLAK